MKCYIYKSPKKDQLYLFLKDADAFDALPQALLEHFGTPRFVMELELTPQRSLARTDPREVIHHLQSQGYYLQMPPANPLLS